MLHGYEPIEMAVRKKRFITCHNFEHTFVIIDTYWHIPDIDWHLEKHPAA